MGTRVCLELEGKIRDLALFNMGVEVDDALQLAEQMEV